MPQDKLHEELRALSNLISQVEASDLRRELLESVADGLRTLVEEDGEWVN